MLPDFKCGCCCCCCFYFLLSFAGYISLHIRLISTDSSTTISNKRKKNETQQVTCKNYCWYSFTLSWCITESAFFNFKFFCCDILVFSLISLNIFYCIPFSYEHQPNEREQKNGLNLLAELLPRCYAYGIVVIDDSTKHLWIKWHILLSLTSRQIIMVCMFVLAWFKRNFTIVITELLTNQSVFLSDRKRSPIFLLREGF